MFIISNELSTKKGMIKFYFVFELLTFTAYTY